MNTLDDEEKINERIILLRRFFPLIDYPPVPEIQDFLNDMFPNSSNSKIPIEELAHRLTDEDLKKLIPRSKVKSSTPHLKVNFIL